MRGGQNRVHIHPDLAWVLPCVSLQIGKLVVVHGGLPGVMARRRLVQIVSALAPKIYLPLLPPFTSSMQFRSTPAINVPFPDVDVFCKVCLLISR